MKLNQAKKSLESSGMTVNVDFSIDMNSKAFSVVTEGIYSDIVGTIVRELSSNAYDSHVEAGKSNVPFEVSCPTHFDPFFAVKDFGTGLRYFSYTGKIGKIKNAVDGESTITIDGDIRWSVTGINTIILGQSEIVKIDTDRLLYDATNDVTVLRVLGDRKEGEIQIEFDDTLVLYSTYFRSTKEQSNDYIGAYGLGSKTPLAYTDNFIVTNRFNGVERTYNILTNEDNKPQISLMNSTTTDDSNGLEIKLAVEPDDYPSFKAAIQKQLKYFDPLPEIQNEVVSFPKVLYKGEHIIVCDELPLVGWNAYACVGNNAYEINGHKVNSSIFKEHNTALRFNIGDVKVTASRESLKDDEQNNTAIINKTYKAVEEYKKYVFDQLESDSMTELEKAHFINTQSDVIEFTHDEVITFIGNPHYGYGRHVYLPLADWGSYDGIDIVDDQATASQRKIVRKENKRPLSWYKFSWYTEKVQEHFSSVNYNLDPKTMPIIFVKDASYAFLKKINYYLKEIDDTGMWNDGNKPIYVVSYKDKEQGESALDAIRSLMGSDLRVIYLSQIELPKADPADREYECNTPVCRRLGQLYYRIHSPLEWNDEFTPLTRIDNTNAYAVPIDRNTVEFSRVKMELLKKAMASKDKEIDLGLDIDFESIEIYGIPKAKYEKAISYGFTPLEKLIDKIDGQLTIPRKIVNKHYLKNAAACISEMRLISVLINCDSSVINDNLEDNDVKTLIRAVKIFEKRYSDVQQWEEFSDLMTLPDCPDNIKKIVDNIDKVRYNVEHSLALFDEISTYRLYRDEAKQKALVDYINYAMKTETQEN